MAHGKTKEPGTIGVRGFYRLNIVEGDEVVADSGWCENQVTNDGFREYLVYALGSITGSKYVSHIALGNGTIPAAAATGLDAEVYSSTRRQSVTTATVAGSKGLLLTATFSSTVFNTATTIANIGLFNSSTAGTLFAGSTYGSSAVATNQAVNVSYQINFS